MDAPLIHRVDNDDMASISCMGTERAIDDYEEDAESWCWMLRW